MVGSPKTEVRRRRYWHQVGLLAPATALLAVCFVIPLSGILWQSLSRDTSSALSVDHYVKALTDPYYLDVLWTTVRLSLWITTISFLLGYPIAYLAVRTLQRRWLKRLVYLVVVAPLFTSAVVRAFGWMVLLGREGLVNRLLLAGGLIEEPLPLLYSEAGVIIGSVYVLTPFMILTVAGVLQNVDPILEDAAADLGAGPAASFRTVVWPLNEYYRI